MQFFPPCELEIADGPYGEFSEALVVKTIKCHPFSL